MKKITNGFTMVELLSVVAIIGILSIIGVVSFSRIQISARDTQRSSKINIVYQALEKYYENNGEYPNCAALTADPNTVTTSTLKGLDPNVLSTPSASQGTTNSFACTDPVSDTFAYIGGGNQYTLKYKEEGSGSIKSLTSLRQITASTWTLTIAAGANGTVNTGGTYASGSSQTITATPDANYSFASWSGSTGCSGTASHSITMDANKSCTASFILNTIAAPSDPIVTVSQLDATTTQWSWGAAPCTGNTARYQYRYTTSPIVFDSGWVATAGTSVPFTTSTEGQTYTVEVQAQCYTGGYSSNWSGSGSNFYYRPVTTYTLTLAAGTGGTVSGAGTFNSGTAHTMTATANANYTFSSWTGSTGCSGIASHSITMDANKSCTANFTYTPPTYTLTLVAAAGGSVSGNSGTYSSGSTPTISAYPNSGYTFSYWYGSAACSGAQSHTVTMNADISCGAAFTYSAPVIPTPTTPYITASSDATYTTFSWATYNCGSGNPTNWLVRYTISSGYDSGWNTQSAYYDTYPTVNNMVITSTRYQTYTYQVQAACFDTASQTMGSYSGIGSASYYRP